MRLTFLQPYLRRKPGLFQKPAKLLRLPGHVLQRSGNHLEYRNILNGLFLRQILLQHQLQSRRREFIDPQCTGKLVLLHHVDVFLPSDDDPRLRSPQQLIAAEAHYIRTLCDRILNGRFICNSIFTQVYEYSASQILDYRQETLHNQLEDLKSRLPEYGVIGVGREDGKEKGEYSPVWYKKDRFSLQSSGYFWLSETPDVAGSKGWDGACERIATWAIFKDKYTNNAVFFINTHLDHQGVVARREGVNLLFQKINEYSLGMPVICTGDFNSSPDSDVIAHITDAKNDNHLTDSRNVSPVVYGPAWSWHDFGALSYSQRPLLDYVFVRGGLKVNRYGVLAEDENGMYLSDHAPVLVNVSFE